MKTNEPETAPGLIIMGPDEKSDRWCIVREIKKEGFASLVVKSWCGSNCSYVAQIPSKFYSQACEQCKTRLKSS